MTAIARPALRSVSPIDMLGDANLVPIAAAQTPARSALGDYWSWITALDMTATQTANTVLAGPTSGGAAAPTFRALVTADLPTTVDLVTLADGTVPAGSTVANTTTNTPFAQFYQIPANYVLANSFIRVRAWGTYNTAIAAPNLTTQVKIGSVVVLAVTTTLTTGRSNNGWCLFADIFVTAVGGAGSVEAQGYVMFANVAAGAKGSDINHIANTAAVGSVPFNVAQNVAISVQWSAASVSNSITLRGFSVEIAK